MLGGLPEGLPGGWMSRFDIDGHKMSYFLLRRCFKCHKEYHVMTLRIAALETTI